jgi:hypothetical protein
MDNQAKKAEEAFKITSNWHTQAKSLKEKYTQLTDSDLKFEPGKEADLIKRIETRLNKKHDEVVNILKKGLISAS